MKNEAEVLIKEIADDVRPDANKARIQRSIQLILGSFAPEHIIIELLQNADDVEATTAKIELTDNGIFLLHDGEEFSEAHLRALCDIGKTTKKPGVHIGYMGIGFKAAFKVSDKPHVFSGPYRFHFTRNDVFVPYWVEATPPNTKKYIKEGMTTFFLPFRQDLPSEVVNSLKETALNKLEPLCLVFLRNIAEISITCDNTVRTLTKKTIESSKEPFLHREKVDVTEKKNNEETTYGYVVFNKTLEIPEHARNDYRVKESSRVELKTTDVTLAFSLKENLLQPKKSVLYTFLPTQFETGLNFAINCDFLLNTQRSEPDFTSKWDLWLLESIGGFLREVVGRFLHDKKQARFLYDVLPRKADIPPKLFAKIAVPLIDHMKNSRSVLTSEGKLAKPSEVALASKDVQEIIPPSKASVKHYVDHNVRGHVFLREELGVMDYLGKPKETEYVLKALQDIEWLTSLKANQIRAIYEFLYRKLYAEDKKESWELGWYEHSKIEEQLEELRIVRAADGKQYKAKETLLPGKLEKQTSETVSLPCLIFVDSNVLSPQGEELLKKMGASDFSDETVIERILDGQSKEEWKNWSEEERLKSVSHVAKWIKKSDYSVRSGRIKSKLGNLILPIGGNGWAPSSACYFPVQKLKELFPDGRFVCIQKLESLLGSTERFLETIGVLKFPRVLKLGKLSRKSYANSWEVPKEVSKENWKDYLKWLGEEDHLKYSTREEAISFRCLDGFSKYVSLHDATKMERYLSFLLNYWQKYKPLMDTYYTWFHYYQYEKKVPSYFAYQLKKYAWSPTSEGLRIAKETFAPLREIKLVGGNLLPYLNVSEEQARVNKEFLQFLGIETEISLQMLLSILKKAKDAEVNEALKKQLARVYSRAANLCEDQKIEEVVPLQSTDGSFVPSRELYWMDDSEAEEVFRVEIPSAWVPENLSRPAIETFFEAFGVTRISSILKRQRVDDGQEVIEEAQWTADLLKKKDFLYSVLLHHKASEAEKFPEFIKKVVVVKTARLRLRLSVMDKVREIEPRCFCDIEDGKIFVSPTTQGMDVARELVRAFGAPRGSEFTLDFVLSQSPENISSEFKKSSIRSVPLPEIETPLKVTLPSLVEAVEAIEDELMEIPEVPAQAVPQPQETGVGEPEVEVEMNKKKIFEEVERAKKLLDSGATPSYGPSDIWREAKEIERVTSKQRVTIRPLVTISTEKDWEPRYLDGEKVFIQIGIQSERIEASRPHIKAFRERMRKIVEVMGGNPDTVNVCIAYPITDADRRENQLLFNVLRDDKPLRWIVVAARELAYLKYPNLGQPHINLMTNLIEKALERIHEIDEKFKPAP